MLQVLCGPLGNKLFQHLTSGPRRIGPYQFVAAAPSPVIMLEVTARELPTPFLVRTGGRVLLSEYLSERIAAYAGLSLPDYAHLIALCGVLQARVLQLNPLLVPEDLIHDSPVACVLARRCFLDEFFPVVEAPQLCPGCQTFYRRLLPPGEMAAVRAALEKLVPGIALEGR